MAAATGNTAIACRRITFAAFGWRTASTTMATPQVSAKMAPTNGLKKTEQPSVIPISQIALAGAALPAETAAVSAITPSAYDMPCCGTYQRHRGSPSTRCPPKNQLLSASTFNSRRADNGSPRRQIRYSAYAPSALEDVNASAVA